ALYNTIAHDRRQADAVIDAILAVDPGLTLLVLAGAPLQQWAADRGLRVVAEAFADRAYNDDGSLVARREPGAVLHDAEAVAERMVRLVRTGEIESINGRAVRLQAGSICVHGDSPGAVEMARSVRAHLLDAGLALAPFVDRVQD
ncbi:MAG: LamB/YcsF family protein, partial [Comamonadaceae bacterium]